jgi:hypothetical protein
LAGDYIRNRRVRRRSTEFNDPKHSSARRFRKGAERRMARALRPAPTVPFVRLRRWKPDVRTECAAYWVAALRSARLFPCGRSARSIRRLLAPIKARAPSPSRRSSTKSLRSSSSPLVFRRRHTCSGFIPRATSPACSSPSLSFRLCPSAEVPAPLCSVLRLSQPLDGLCRTQACRLISSCCHVQGCLPSRGFSSVAANARGTSCDITRTLAPMPLPIVARRARFGFRLVAPAPTCDVARLRGLAPRRTAFPDFGYSPPPEPLPSSGYVAPSTHAPEALIPFACARGLNLYSAVLSFR